jgi:hypothetical protein
VRGSSFVPSKTPPIIRLKKPARGYAEQIYFSVIPSSVRMAVEPKFSGCRATIKDNKTGEVCECVCAEIGPSHHLGEASMAVCSYFGINPDPKKGGSSDKKRWLYHFYPGVAAEGWKLI